MLVKLWMTKEPVIAKKEMSIAEADALLRENNIRRIPVVEEGGELIGILSKEDISKALPSVINPDKEETQKILAEQANVASFMTEVPITVSPETPLEKAVQIMLKNKVGGIPVLQEKKLVGIISESDVFRSFITVLGKDDESVQVELIIDQGEDAFYEVIGVLQEYNVEVVSILILNKYSKDRQLMGLKIVSEEIDKVIEGFWESGMKVNSVIPDSGNIRWEF